MRDAPSTPHAQANLFGLGDPTHDADLFGSFGQDDDFMGDSMDRMQDFGDLGDRGLGSSLDDFETAMPNSFDLVAQQSATVFPAPSPDLKQKKVVQETRRASSHSLDLPNGVPSDAFRPEDGLSPDTLHNLRKSLEAPSPAGAHVPWSPPRAPSNWAPARVPAIPPAAPAKTVEDTRGRYKCGRCGQIKVNHICPFASSQPRNAEAQCDDPRRLVRRSDRDECVTVTRMDAMSDDDPKPSADGDYVYTEKEVTCGTFVPAILTVDEDGPGRRSHRRTDSGASLATLEGHMDAEPTTTRKAPTPRPGPPAFAPHPWAAAFASSTKAGPPGLGRQGSSMSSLESTQGPAPALAFPPYNPAAFAAACAARGVPPPPFFAGLPPRPFFAAPRGMPLPPGMVPLPPGVLPPPGRPPPRGLVPLPPGMGGFRVPALMSHLSHLTPQQLQSLVSMSQVQIHPRPPPPGAFPRPPAPPAVKKS